MRLELVAGIFALFTIRSGVRDYALRVFTFYAAKYVGSMALKIFEDYPPLLSEA